MVPGPDAVTFLGLDQLLLCSAGDAPAPCFSPLPGAAQTSKSSCGAGAGLHQH